MRISRVDVSRILGLLMLMPLSAWAGEAVLTWTNSSMRIDGSPLASSEIAATLIEYGLCADGKVPASPQTATAQGSAMTLTIQDLGAGAWCFQASTRDTDGLTSAPSNVASKTIVPAAPAPPSNLTVQAGALTAYTLQTASGRLVMLPVGTVPAGTACDGAQHVSDANGVTAYVVSATAVQWAGSVHAQTVLAACG